MISPPDILKVLDFMHGLINLRSEKYGAEDSEYFSQLEVDMFNEYNRILSEKLQVNWNENIKKIINR